MEATLGSQASSAEQLLELALASLDPESAHILTTLPLLPNEPGHVDGQCTVYLTVTTEGSSPDFYLSLGSKTNPRIRLKVDFNRGKLGYRLRHSSSMKQDLARAVGVKPGIRPTILDLTAGLGKDTFVLASLSCQVLAIERNPLVYVVLADGLRRANTDPDSAGACANITLRHADAMAVLQQPETGNYDVIYLDPMYPHRRKSALVKQEMRVLREYTGDDDDAQNLLATALTSGVKRVTVKRPLHAPLLSDAKPDLQYLGKSTRFDVYIAG